PVWKTSTSSPVATAARCLSASAFRTPSHTVRPSRSSCCQEYAPGSVLRSQRFAISGVVAAPLDGDLALELEDLDLLDRVALAPELVPAEERVEEPEVRAAREVAHRAHLGGREHGVPGERRGGGRPARVAHARERIVADVGRRQPEAESERDAAVDDQLPAEIA